MTGMDVAALRAERLRRHRLTGASLATPEDVVGWQGAVQSQEFEPAKWSIGLRLRSENADAVHRAYEAGSIVRTHILRPTWHFVDADDLTWMVEAAGEAVLRSSNAHMHRLLELDTRTLNRSASLIEKALTSGVHLTRKEISAMLEGRGIAATHQRLAYIVMHAELRGLICSGRMRGKQHTYALASERVPPGPAVDRDEARRKLVLRYFQSHGPANEHDFRWWVHLRAAEAREAIESASDELEARDIDGVTHWTSGTRPGLRRSRESAFLLQGYDEYFSMKDKTLVDPDPNRRIFPAEGVFDHAVVLDGYVVGQWRRRFGSDMVTVEIQPYRRYRREERAAIEEAAARYARFIGLDLELTVLPISAGP